MYKINYRKSVMTTEIKTITPAPRKTVSVRLHPEDNARLQAIKETQKFTGNFPDFMTTFIDRSTGGEMFNNNDYAKLQAAADKLGLSVESIIIKGAMKYASRAMLSDPEKQQKTADTRVQDFVESVMEANEKAKDWFDKHELTQGFISKGIKEATGKEVNRVNITSFIAANETRLKDHHAKCGIEPDHNRKVFNYERKHKKG
jgi:hypothetical protein